MRVLGLGWSPHVHSEVILSKKRENKRRSDL